MKSLLLFTLFILKISGFSPEDQTKFEEDISKMSKEISPLSKIKSILTHPYFEKFEEYEGILGTGGFGLVIKAKMDLLNQNEPPFLPVALKIIFKLNKGDWTVLQNYMKMLIPEGLESVKSSNPPFTVLDASDHFRNLTQSEPEPFKVPFMAGVYEAVSLELAQDSGKPLKVVAYAMQLGFSDMQHSFMDPSLKEQNTRLVKESLVEIAFGFSKLHGLGMMHGDVKLNNFMVQGDPTHWNPLVIDFDKMKNFSELKASGRQIKEEMFKRPGEMMKFWKSEFCYVSSLGALQRPWMRVDVESLNLGYINPNTNSTQFFGISKGIVPIGADLSEETLLLVTALMGFINDSTQFAYKKTPLPKQIPQNNSTPVDVNDPQLKAMFLHLKKLSDRSSRDNKDRLTSLQLFEGLYQILGEELDFTAISQDEFLQEYLTGVNSRKEKRQLVLAQPKSMGSQLKKSLLLL